MIQKNLKKLPMLFSSAFICTVMMLIVYMVKDIWPFGTVNVTYDDMAQGTLPIYYHLYDWLHGAKAMAFDWYTGLGVNVVNSGTITPLDFIMYFFDRDKLYYQIGILVIVKVAASAVTSKYTFDKLFDKTSQVWRILFSVMYAMSTYSMFYYTNAFWLDFVVIFPLVIYGLKRLLVDNKPLIFILFFSYTLYLSVYIGFMITLGVFFLSGLYILLLCKKEKRGQRTCLLGLSTVTGILLSAWHSVPMAMQIFTSKRLATSINGTKKSPLLDIYLTDPISAMPTKLMLTVGLQLAFVLTTIFIIKLVKDKKRNRAIFVGSGVFIFFAPVFIEFSNLFWHGGSYIQFPMRFLFISIFALLSFALACINTYGESLITPKKDLKKPTIYALIVFLILLFLAGSFLFALRTLGKFKHEPTLSYVKVTGFSVLYCAGIPLFALLLCQKKYITRILCVALCIVQTYCICYAGFANPFQKGFERMDYNDSAFYSYCLEASQFDLECGELGRVKNADTSLNTNYPFILGTPALSNWTHNIPHYMQLTASSLGYSTQFTRLLDAGGTAFTDSLFGVKKLIVRKNANVSSQYQKLDITDNFALYENNYALETGLLGDETLLNDITKSHNSTRFDTQNKLYSALTGSDEKLFTVISDRKLSADRLLLLSKSKKEISFLYTAGKNEVLYLNAVGFSEKSFEIFVNGNKVYVPQYKNVSSTLYPTAAVNGIFTIGSFDEGKNITVTLRCADDKTFSKELVQLAYMSLDKLTVLNEMYKDTVTNIETDRTSLTVNYNNTHGKGKYMFLPITYDTGWKCTINGEEAEVLNALGSYIAIELPEGSGSFTLSHTSPGLKIGLIMSIIGLLMAGILLLLKRRDYELPKFITLPVLWIFLLMFIFSTILFYIVPVFLYIINIIVILKKRHSLKGGKTNG